LITPPLPINSLKRFDASDTLGERSLNPPFDRFIPRFVAFDDSANQRPANKTAPQTGIRAVADLQGWRMAVARL
jgi:hypothetical protein